MAEQPVHLSVEVTEHLADTITPVSAYLRLRDRYPRTLLLESSDYQPGKNSFSYLCMAPLAEFSVQQGKVRSALPGQKPEERKIQNRKDVLTALRAFQGAFFIQSSDKAGLSNGLFGHFNYDCVRYFDTHDLPKEKAAPKPLPDISLLAYRYIVAIDHHRNVLYLLHNRQDGEEPLDREEFLYDLRLRDFAEYSFERVGERASNMSEEQYISIVEKCLHHVDRGDVFQIVPSLRFSQGFRGDDFTLYRQLRSINPSPYLFYFDFGNYRVFGSSPEAHLRVADRQASLFPIAGTCPRSESLEEDEQRIGELLGDEKENAEHVMLVDLARNDLNRHCANVYVAEYREVEQYSHVIHLTSRVTGELLPEADALSLLEDTFPMGTLSGAPKYRAIDLLSDFEPTHRGPYGGAIGCLGFDSSCNFAIMIRTFLSVDSRLYYQAGAGVVADSKPERELNEALSKLGALEAALLAAEGEEQ